ncbi:MAG: hypothetical protein HY865_07850 [Chloroflexi bacterium]|nr:hypothetical protein [Chloroflexota bacterium]
MDENDIKTFLILAGVLVCICVCLCMIAALVWRYSPPKMGLFEPTPTAIPPCPSIPTGWVEVMNDQFDGNVNLWPLGKDTNSYADTNTEIKNGILEWSLTAHQDVYYHIEPGANNNLQKDFYLTTDVRQADGPLNSEYGVTFHLLGWKHYYFSISDTGEVLVKKRSSRDGDDTEQLYWDFSSNVRPGEYNKLTVFAQGSHFTFCVNQQVVVELDDDTYTKGRVGIAMGLDRAADEAIIEYDNYTVYAP